MRHSFSFSGGRLIQTTKWCAICRMSNCLFAMTVSDLERLFQLPVKCPVAEMVSLGSRASVSKNTAYVAYETNYNDHLRWSYHFHSNGSTFKATWGHVSCQFTNKSRNFTKICRQRLELPANCAEFPLSDDGKIPSKILRSGYRFVWLPKLNGKMFMKFPISSCVQLLTDRQTDRRPVKHTSRLHGSREPAWLVGWRFGVAVTHWSRSTQLLCIEPGYILGWVTAFGQVNCLIT